MEILRSKEEKRILTGHIVGIEDEYYKLQNKVIPCAIIWYENTKVLIPITYLNIKKESKSLIRGMIGAEVDFIVIEYDSTTNIAIASRTLAMKLRKELEIPKLKVNDVVKVRIVAVARKYITEGGEYIGKVIGYPKQRSGIIVQLENSDVTCLVRVPAHFNSIPHLFDKVLIRIYEIYESKKLVYGVIKRIISV